MKMSSASMVLLSHPSVRVIGTENDYIPAQCSDPRCSNVVIHMHCPFCVKTELYHDARILKAHYRVKHVDKGIHFAGLKILRCCEQCDIVGAIKGEKKFKGAHWHCYKCKNGFNRRDEAVKHYKTHFRHPYTTFQIHVSQEVNNPMWCQDRKDDDTENSHSLCRTFPTTFGITSIILKNGDQPLVNETSQEDSICNVEVPSSTISDDIAAIVQPTDGQTAIMIIEGDQAEGAATVATSKNISESMQPKLSIERTIVELKEEIQKLKEEKQNTEVALNTEIKQLKSKIEQQNKEIEELRKHEKELLDQITVPSDGKMQQLVTSLQVQHAQMLQDHLMQVRKEAFMTTIKEFKNGGIDLSQTLQRSSVVGNQQIVAVVVQDTCNSMLSPNFPVSYTTCNSTIDASNGVNSELRGSQSTISSSPISTNLVIATEIEHEKTLKSICDSCTNDVEGANRSSSKLLLINRNQYENTQDIVSPAKGFAVVSDGAECADNFIVPSSACGNLVVQVSANSVEKQAGGLDLSNEANGNISFLSEEQLRNCMGATANLFSQGPANPYHLFISQKPEPLIMQEKRKLFFAEYPDKKHVKNSS